MCKKRSLTAVATPAHLSQLVLLSRFTSLAPPAASGHPAVLLNSLAYAGGGLLFLGAAAAYK